MGSSFIAILLAQHTGLPLPNIVNCTHTASSEAEASRIECLFS